MTLQSKECPIDITVKILANKWTVPIMIQLMTGPKRPSDLERALKGLSAKTLAERLHDLQTWGIIQRNSFPEVPPRVEYSLTEIGKKLDTVLAALSEYGKFWKENAKMEVHTSAPKMRAAANNDNILDLFPAAANG